MSIDNSWYSLFKENYILKIINLISIYRVPDGIYKTQKISETCFLDTGTLVYSWDKTRDKLTL